MALGLCLGFLRVVLLFGAFSSTPTDDGLTLAIGVLNLDPADGTHAGGVSTTTQTFAGVKTFSSVPVAAGISAPTTSGFTLAGNVTTGGTAIGVVVDNLVALTTAGAKIVSFQNHEVEKAYIDKDGRVFSSGLKFSTYVSDLIPGIGREGGNDNQFMLGYYSGITYLRGETSLFLQVGTSSAAEISATVADFSGLGNGGAIKLKSPDGTTYTLTVANGGAWAHSP